MNTTVLVFVLMLIVASGLSWLAYETAWQKAASHADGEARKNYGDLAAKNLEMGKRIGWREAAEAFERFSPPNSAYASLDHLLGKVAIEEESTS